MAGSAHRRGLARAGAKTSLQVVALALGFDLALSCGCAEVDAAAVRGAVEANLREHGLAVQSVACPDDPTPPTQCRASLGDGTVLTMKVARTGDRLSVASAEPIVVVGRLVPEVRAKLEGVGHVVASVRCDGLVWRTVAGSVGRCEMIDEAGRRWVYEATFSGEGSEHRAAISAAPAPADREVSG